ncbi:MAG: EAL domain-containing protein [Gammaproteobacteria bacterium]|nr:EAL domain-containing protein [Gammaproteobacteria bacterium]
MLKQQPGQAVMEDENANINNERRPRALVVDDDPAIRRLVCAVAKQAGFTAEEAEDGRLGLEIFEKLRPDLVLLDVMMPRMDGFDTCAALRELPCGAHVPIIFMTGLEDIPSVERAYELGATDFVTKPLNYPVLTHRLRYILRGKALADELRASEQRLSRAQRVAKVGLWEWDAQSNMVRTFDATGELFKPGWNTLCLADYLARVSAGDREAVQSIFTDSSLDTSGLEYSLMLSDGSERIVHQQTEPGIREEDSVRQIFGTVHDITDRMYADQQIRVLTNYDPVTGLPNRRFLTMHLDRILENAERYRRTVAIVSLALDNFKRIEDTFGHEARDHLLRKLADRLRDCVRGGDCISRGAAKNLDGIARVGGHRFVIVLSEIRKAEDAAAVVERTKSALARPFTVQHNEINLTASSGISVFPADGNSSDALLKYADLALTAAQDTGRNRYKFYTRTIDSKLRRRHCVEARLRRALQRNEPSVRYQPKLRIATDEIVGVEARLSWSDPELGAIETSELLSVAAEAGLIVELNEWMLRAVCLQNRAWHASGMGSLAVSLNISPTYLNAKHFANHVAEILHDTNLPASLLELALSESDLTENHTHAMRNITELRDMGVEISLDDFGTGSSSLDHLRRLPVTGVKIHASFVHGIKKTSRDTMIVRAILALAKGMELKTTAQGVEKPRQLIYLRSKGCDEAQGSLISPPVAADKFANWLSARAQVGPSEHGGLPHSTNLEDNQRGRVTSSPASPRR